MTDEQLPANMTVQQVSKYLQLDVKSVRDLLLEGHLRGFKVGTKPKSPWRVPRAELERFMRMGRKNW